MKAFANKETEFHRSGARQNSQLETALWSSVSTPTSNFQIQRSADCACGGECPTCQAKGSDLPISHPTDASEIEADATADKIMRMEMPGKGFGAPGEKKLQKMENGGSGGIPNVPRAISETINSPGRSMDEGTHSFMESRFGYDFSGVKIHDNASAGKSADSINARAYTLDNNIVFNSGQYDPNSESGKHLLAHELAHVVQQGTGVAPKIQRLGDLSKVPPMACDVANSSPGGTVALSPVFPTSSPALSAAQISDIAIFVASWQASGGTDALRVDGYASTPGADEMNWQLSCDRALSVANELRNNGVPDNLITIFANGETSEFGAEGNNQRAEITMRGVAAGPAPAPGPAGPAPAPAGNISAGIITGGVAGLTMNVTATYNDCSACVDGLEVIQVFWGTRRTDGVQVGTHQTVFPPLATTYDSFVDGGINSPGGAVYAGNPYYIGRANLPASYGYNAGQGSAGVVAGCTVNPSDTPGAATLHDQAFFETAFVCLNFQGTGRDKLLEAFKWGFINLGTTFQADPSSPSGGGIVITLTPGAKFEETLRADYPGYSHT